MIKFELSSKKSEFFKISGCHLELIASQRFADEMGDNSNERGCLMLCIDMGQHIEAIFSM